jgi:anti-sigma factor RsiW
MELVEIVTDYLEGSMSEPERARFEHHLTECEGCENYLQEMRAMLGMLGKILPESLPDAACDDLLVAFRDWRAAR